MAETHIIESPDTSPPLDNLPLPPEIRLRIYSLVLSAEVPLLLASKQYPDEVRLNVSLLTVSKSIYAEASDAFYETNSIRFWRKRELNRAVKNDLRCVKFVRHLELVNVTKAEEWMCKSTPTTIQTCLGFPKLKTLTIAYDALPTSLTSFCNVQGIDTRDLHCLDIGRYRLGDGEVQHVYFKHYGLIKAWERVKATDISIEDLKDSLQILQNRPPLDALIEYVSKVDLATWCAVYDLWQSGDFDDPYGSLVYVLFLGGIKSWPRTHASLGADVRVRDLDPAKHGTELVHWFSELLTASQTRWPTGLNLFEVERS